MLLLRHASAGERLSSPSSDAARGLDRVGRLQALWLPAALSDYEITRVVSSPLARCVESVLPLAWELDLGVEERDELLPGAGKRATLALLRELPAHALVCTHREVLESLFDSEVRCEKGGAWIVDHGPRGPKPMAYLPPPKRPARTRPRLARVS